MLLVILGCGECVGRCCRFQLSVPPENWLWHRFWMLLVILVSVVGRGAEELLQAASWSSALVGPVLTESDDVGAGGGEDVLDVGLREPSVPAVA
ncbi:hypothetical protein AAH979_18475 [Plantactinospora sp. ZYX-F-223]|uniref:hypothetical protein n=1 Tax=Plantactinospora sp. ZYX-F-223 TaxID=3144103 RepID=UPI0031FDF28C